ncbi:MAG: TIGR02099 family protein [Gammaproteobacteria bacterium]|nr:TIGR02099 family protein [Gammaproteobacteria bacterium]
MHKSSTPVQTPRQRLAQGARALAHFVRHGGRRPFTARLHRWSGRLLHSLWYGSALVLTLLALTFSVARLWLLPALAEKNLEIAAYLSEQSGYPVTIERLDSYWDGLNPGLRAFEFAVAADARGRPVVRLKELRLSLAWLPLLIGRVEINSLVMVEPRLVFERLVDGRFRIGGFDPLDLESPAEQTGFIQWLFAQRELIVENGELLWLDHKRGAQRLTLTQVSLSLRNIADRHQLGVRALFPASLCERCAFIADVSGNPLIDDDWTGKMFVEAVGLNIEKLPPIVREILPDEFRGRFSLRLWSEWKNNSLQLVKGDVGVADLRLPVPGLHRPLAVRQAQTDLVWRGGDETWYLDLNKLRLALTGAPWSAGRLRIEQRFEDTVVRIKHVDIGDVSRFVAGVEQKNQVLDWMRALRPSGALNEFKLVIDKNWFNPAHYVLETEAAGLAVAAHRDFPGLSGVNGRLSVHPRGGEFVLDSAGGQVDLRQVFRAPLEWQQAEGRVRWQRTDEYWQVNADKLRLRSPDGRASGALELRLPHQAVAPYLKLRFDFKDLNGAHAGRYFPAILPGEIRAWLERAIVAGTGTAGHAIFDGRIDEFPFRDGNGTFEVAAHVHNALFEYLPRWPRIEQGEVDLLFRGPEMLITASSGRIGTLAVGQVVVSIADLGKTENQQLRINGRASGSLGDTLRMLYETPPKDWQALLVPGLRGEGQGSLALDITVPLSAEPNRLDGEYQFQRAALHTPVKGLSLEAIDGRLAFNQSGITGLRVGARILGGPAELRSMTDTGRGRSLTLEGEGRFTSAGLEAVLGRVLTGRLEGAAAWRGRMTLAGGVPAFFWESDLQGLGVNLPAPLDKARAVSAPLTARTVTAGADHHVLEVRLDQRLSAQLAFLKQAPGWAFNKGRVNIGGPPAVLPDQAGLYLNLRAARLDADRWLDYFAASTTPSREPGMPAWLTRVTADIGALRLFGHDLGALSLDVGKWPGDWHGQIKGDALGGSVLWPVTAGVRGVPHFSLDYLVLPDRFATDNGTHVDPRDLPALSLKTAALKWSGKNWGELEFAAAPFASGWRIGRLRLAQPHTAFQVHGDWRLDSAGKPVTELEVEVASDDLGKTLTFLGYPDEIAGGELTLTSKWSWPGGPGAFGFERLNGALTLAAGKGRLLKVQQGAGRLLGVLNISSITRYLSLDFSGIFGKGFNFDTIRGQVSVEHGNAYTQGLSIKGTSASLQIAGRVGLAVRDLDLEIGVTPRFGEELTITSGLLGGPAVGAAVALMQNLLKPQIEESTRVNYSVKGGWDEPTVVKLSKPGIAEPAAEN